MSKIRIIRSLANRIFQPWRWPLAGVLLQFPSPFRVGAGGKRQLPDDQVLVAGLGSQGDWSRHWERMLRV